ncbi:TPA: protein kinase domain-containing protein [Legionella anisa]
MEMKNEYSFTGEIENPSIYNITLTQEQLNAVNELILNDLSRHPAETIHKRKDPATCGQIPYTVLKTSSQNYFLMGWGHRNGNENAFFGRGVNCKGVKGAVLLRKADNYIISNEIYAIKIVEEPKNMIVGDKLTHEKELFKEVYGFGELIHRNNKYYLIMPKMPGILISKLDYAHMSIEELINLLCSIFGALSMLHAKGIFHQDFKIDDLIYDGKSNTTYLIDFEFSAKEPKLQFRYDLGDSVQAATDVINQYAKAHSIPKEECGGVYWKIKKVICQLFDLPLKKMKGVDDPVYKNVRALFENTLEPISSRKKSNNPILNL